MAGLVDMLGGYGPGELDQRRALERQMGAQAQPYRQAVGEADRRARGNAMTVAQGSGNPFLAQRAANDASARATAPLLAQQAAAESGIVRDQIGREQERRAADQQRFERYLGAGLQAGATGLGGLLQGFGGPGGQTGGAPQPMAQMPAMAPQMAVQQPAQIPATGPTSAVPGGIAQGGIAQSMNPYSAPMEPGSGAIPVGSQYGAQRPPELADMLQRGGGTLATMFPGYGSLAAMGLGGLASMLR
jgi:hypothetical protein